MWTLLYKELRLAAHPTLFVFTLLGALVIVPAYPYGMVFVFGCLAPYITCMYGRETQDIYFTALLPIRKTDVVKGKCILFACMQIGQLLFSLPFALLRARILPDGNVVGIEPNAAYYGFGLMIFALFDLIFLTQFFKTGHKAGKAFLLAGIPCLLLVVAMETLTHIPALAWLDGTSPDLLLRQLPLLLIGLALYVCFLPLVYRLAARRFERVDL